MKPSIGYAIALLCGAAIGSLITYKLIKSEYDEMLNAEVESLNRKYGVEDVEEEPQKEEKKPATEDVHGEPKTLVSFMLTPEAKKIEAIDYSKIIRKHEYNPYDAMVTCATDNALNIEEETEVERPYIIDADDFGEFSNYTVIELVYFADKQLTDDDGELVDDVVNTVGVEALAKFKDEDVDVVNVRNDRLKSDYEIVRDYRDLATYLKDRGYKQ